MSGKDVSEPQHNFVKSEATGKVYTVVDGAWIEVLVESYESENDFPDPEKHE